MNRWIKVSFLVTLLVCSLAALSVTAFAAEETYEVKVSAVGTNGQPVSAHVMGGGSYAKGTKITLTASTVDGYDFVGWFNGNTLLSSGYEYSLTVTKGETLTAKYTPKSGVEYSVTFEENTTGSCQVNKTKVAPGTAVTVTYSGDENFLYWEENGHIVSTKPSYTFFIVRNMTLRARTGPGMNLYLNAFGQPWKMSAEAPTVAESPRRMGQTFNGWQETGRKQNGMWVYKPGYNTVQGGTYTVEVCYNDEPQTSLKKTPYYGVYVDLFAPAAPAEKDDKNFQYWQVNGETVSYDHKLTVVRANAGTVKANAVYDNGTAQPGALGVVTQSYAYENKGADYMAHTMNYYVPENYLVKEVGFVYGTDARILNNSDVLSLVVDESSNIRRMASATLSANSGIYTVNASVGTNNTLILYARGYVIYIDGQGNENTVYSDGAFGSYNSLIGKVEVQGNAVSAPLTLTTRTGSTHAANVTLLEGTKLDGVASNTEVKLVVKEQLVSDESSALSFSFDTTADSAGVRYFDISVVDGNGHAVVDKGNTELVQVTVKAALPAGQKTVEAFHADQEMTRVMDITNLTEADRFYYDETTGDVTIAVTHFSQFSFGYSTFTTKFTNYKKYLYRVGNKNAVSLGSLFATEGEVDSSKVTAEVTNAGNAGGTVTADDTDWTKGTIKFTGTGVVTVILKYNGKAVFELNLEVVDGYNATEYSDVKKTDVNTILLDNIEMTAGGQISLSNCTLFGNGFTFDVSNGKTTGKNDASNYLVALKGATLDNVKVVGAVYTSYGATSSSSYNNATVLINGGNSKILNSYISNCAAPVRALASVTIENTTLKGGVSANLVIRGGQIVLKNVTTINQIGMNDKASDGSDVVGLGIVFYYENVPYDTTLTVDGLTQYNWISKTQANNIKDSYGNQLANKVFESAYSQYQYTDSKQEKWANTGIVSMTSTVGAGNIDCKNTFVEYAGQSASFGVTGYVYAPLAKCPITDVEKYESNAQGIIAPTITWTHTSDDNCKFADGAIQISFKEDNTYQWKPSKLTVKNHLNTDISSSVTMKLDGAPCSGPVTFSKAGEHTMVYSYTDPANYRMVENQVESYPVTYSVILKINVVTQSAGPIAQFYFGNGSVVSDATTNVVEINGDYYVMPENSSSTTIVSAQTIKVFDVDQAKVSIKDNRSDFLYYIPVFDGVVTIVDGNAEYNSATKNMPTTLTAPNITADTFKLSSSSGGATVPETYNNKLYYKSGAQGGNRGVQTVKNFKYKFIDSEGYTYYYFVNYTTPAHNVCVATGTLVTLADGTKKPVEQLTMQDEILAFNHETGEVVSAQINFFEDDGWKEYNVLNLFWSNGQTSKMIGEHGYFDLDLMKYVYLHDDDYQQYIGHRFYTGTYADGVYTPGEVTLENAYAVVEYTGCYSFPTVYHLNFFTEDVLSMPGGITGMFNIFEYGADLRYDEEKMAQDIATYGLFGYENVADMISYETFCTYPAQYINVSIGKGLMTEADLHYLIERYAVKYGV